MKELILPFASGMAAVAIARTLPDPAAWAFIGGQAFSLLIPVASDFASRLFRGAEIKKGAAE